MNDKINIFRPNLQLDDESKSELFSLVVNNITNVWEYFVEKFEIGERNFQYFKGNQWTEEEELAHLEQFRRPYVFNEVFNKIDHIVGTENETRLDTVLIAREKSDEPEVEVLNWVVKWIEQINNLPFIQTSVFTDALIRGCGATAIRWSFDDVEFGYPQIISFPSYELVWDINSKQIDLSDARWLARIQFLSRQSLKEIFPLHADVIDKLSPDSILITKNLEFQNYPYFNRLYAQRYLSSHTNKEQQILPLIEYYDYIVKPTYVVYDDIKNEDIHFEKLEDARDFYDGKIDAYTEYGYPLYNSQGDPNVFIYTINERIYRQTLIVGDEIIDHTDLATPFFPYDVCFAYFSHGDYWAFVDQLISPQDLINRAFSQLDYQLGASEKGIVTVIKSALDKSITIEDFRREYSKTKPIIPVVSHDAIRIWPPENMNPQLFEEVNFGLQRLIDYAGGRNILGYTDKAGESGRAIAERAQQAGIARLPLFDKLKIWRILITKKFVWYIKNVMTPLQLSRILGNDPNIQFKRPIPELIDSIREIEYDIVIDETFKSESIKERYFEQIKNMFLQFPTAPEVVVPTLLEFSSLPESKKKEILDKLQFYQEYTARKQQIEHETNIRKQAEDVIKRKIVRQSMEQQLNVPERKSQKR